MIRIDDTLLEEIGLISLPKAERDQMLRQIYETLEMRVGMKLAERMSDQQLDEFERFIDTNDEAGALKWLENNFPDYKQVVADELEKLKTEIKQDSGKIIEAMRAQGLQPQAQPQQPVAAAPQNQQYYQQDAGATTAGPQQYAQPAAYTQPNPYQQSGMQPVQPQVGANDLPQMQQPQSPQQVFAQPFQPMPQQPTATPAADIAAPQKDVANQAGSVPPPPM